MPASLKPHVEAKRFEQDIARDSRARRVFCSGSGMEKADVRKKAKYARREGLTVKLIDTHVPRRGQGTTTAIITRFEPSTGRTSCGG